MVLKRITTRNVQNHREVVIDLPPTGLVVFTGNNSNGKSVIRKATEKIVSGAIANPRERADLVNRKSVSCEIEYQRDDDVVLLCHIQREANATYFELHRPNETPMRRYLADKSYKDLVREFGWHYDEVSEICLQVATASEALLFYATSPKVNGRVLATATTDSNAEVAAENLTNTIKEVQKYRESYSTKVAASLQTLRGLVIEDTVGMQAKLDKLSRYYRNLSTIYFPTIPEIHAVPVVKLSNFYIPTIPAIRYPKIYGMTFEIPDIIPIAREIKAFKDRRCPTCGRRFDEHDSEDIEHI